MYWRRSWAIAQNDLRILRNDPVFALTLTVMPLLLMAFLKPAFRVALVQSGIHGANGAEQAVPGMTVMFAFFMVGNVGFSLFREHAWSSWDRLRASSALPAEIMIGKVTVPLLILAVQLSVLFAGGGLLFHLNVRGSLFALVTIAVSLGLCLVCMGLAIASVCRTINQLNAITNLGATFFAGLGGALVPISLLPRWARTVAPSTPSYWAMSGFRRVIDLHTGFGAALRPSAVLLAFAISFALVAGVRFRFEESKVGWA